MIDIEADDETLLCTHDSRDQGATHERTGYSRDENLGRATHDRTWLTVDAEDEGPLTKGRG